MAVYTLPAPKPAPKNKDLFSSLTGWALEHSIMAAQILLATEDAFPDIETLGSAPAWASARVIEESPTSKSAFTSALEPLPHELAKEINEQTDVDIISLLSEIAQRGDEQAFVQASKTIDWSSQRAETFIRAIHLAFQAGAHLKARQIAEAGVEQFPDSEELQKLAKLLAPPKIQPNRERANLSQQLNRDWIATNWERDRGNWVAVKDGLLLASAATVRELLDQIGDPRGKDILITQV